MIFLSRKIRSKNLILFYPRRKPDVFTSSLAGRSASVMGLRMFLRALYSSALFQTVYSRITSSANVAVHKFSFLWENCRMRSRISSRFVIKDLFDFLSHL